jgi:hypothetical protein
MALPLPGQEPARLEVERSKALLPCPTASVNQRIADIIANHLRQSAQLRDFNVDIVFQDGTAELAGTVADQPQRDEILRVVQGVPGVERVLNQLVLTPSLALARVQHTLVAQEQIPPPEPAQPPIATPPMLTYPTPANTDPVPIYQAPVPSQYDLNPPRMPPYAWPTYAPYNNYSRVAYPEAYPYQAWPYIGPMYPFPKVPPGWRSVKLEWEDGHWWFSKVATKHDWWRIRYW